MTFLRSTRYERAACASKYDGSLVRANDPGQLVFPRLSKRDGTERGLLYLHGAGLDGNFFTYGADVSTTPHMGEFAQQLIGAGFILVGTQRDQGGSIGVNGFGNDQARTWLSGDRTFLQAASPNGGARAGKIGVVAFSMGGIEAFNLAKTIGAANVAGIVTIEGATDLSWLRGADADDHGTPGAGFFYTSINTAYTSDAHNPHSGTAPTDADWATIAPEHDPMLFAGTSADVPLFAYVNQDDVLIGGDLTPQTKTEEFAATLTTATVKLTATGGHTVLNANADEVIAFFDGLPW